MKKFIDFIEKEYFSRDMIDSERAEVIGISRSLYSYWKRIGFPADVRIALYLQDLFGFDDETLVKLMRRTFPKKKIKEYMRRYKS
jgi:hypothetical protein